MHHDTIEASEDLGEYFRSSAAQELGFAALYAIVSIRRIVGRPLTADEYAELHNLLGLLG